MESTAREASSGVCDLDYCCWSPISQEVEGIPEGEEGLEELEEGELLSRTGAGWDGHYSPTSSNLVGVLGNEKSVRLSKLSGVEKRQTRARGGRIAKTFR